MDLLFSINSLSILLSKLKSFENPKIKLEQHITESNIASDIIFKLSEIDDLENKIILDAGCGTGILGIASLLLNAKKVYFLDIDTDAIKILKYNLQYIEKYIKDLNLEIKLNYEILNIDYALVNKNTFNEKIDIIIENPPFGTKIKFADRAFLDSSFKISTIIYHFHKTSTTDFILKYSQKNNFLVTHTFNYNFHLKKEYIHHKSNKKRIEVSISRISK